MSGAQAYADDEYPRVRGRYPRCGTCDSRCTCGATSLIALEALARHAKRMRGELALVNETVMPLVMTLTKALLELALAAESIEWGGGLEPQPRMRAAVDAAYALADPSGSARRAALRAAGCTSCGAAFADSDPDAAEFCRACARNIPCIACGQKGECSCFT